MKVLLVEDNYELSFYIQKFLERKKYLLEVVNDGEKAEKFIENREFDIYLFDIMLPGKSGIELTKILRKKDNLKPVIILTALSDLENKLEVFESGADDYLIKPFSLEELELRMKAVLRRSKNEQVERIEIKDLVLDLTKLKIFKKGKEIPLTSKEYMVLEYLILNKNSTLSRDKILNHC